MYKDLINQARQAAQSAEQAFFAKHGEPFYCGFAWIEVFVTRTNSQEAKALLDAGFKKSYKPRCLTLWDLGGMPTQSMDIKEAGARAAADILSRAGLRAYACSRAD